MGLLSRIRGWSHTFERSIPHYWKVDWMGLMLHSSRYNPYFTNLDIWYVQKLCMSLVMLLVAGDYACICHESTCAYMCYHIGLGCMTFLNMLSLWLQTPTTKIPITKYIACSFNSVTLIHIYIYSVAVFRQFRTFCKFWTKLLLHTGFKISTIVPNICAHHL